MTESQISETRAGRDAQVQRIILIEGAANLLVLAVKLVVGLFTGSLAILSDAVHSLTDVANNFIAWFVVRLSAKPADREHPYGHRKFEMIAVFGLAMLLAVLAVELALQAVRRDTPKIDAEPWAFGLMIGVLVINVAIAVWQRYWARRLQSDILHADASHTLSDVLTTIVVIAGWQLSAHGYPWLDTVCALAVSALVLYLAFSLFKRALPELVDQYAIDPEVLTELVATISGVRDVKQVRSRWVASKPSIDMVITVDPDLDTRAAHEIADAIEKRLENRLQASDISIHIEPHRQEP